MDIGTPVRRHNEGNTVVLKEIIISIRCLAAAGVALWSMKEKIKLSPNIL